MSELQEWKEKYFQSLEKIEALENRNEQNLDILKKGLIRVSLVADGTDDGLDSYLADLRETLRTKPVAEVEAVISRIDAHLRKLEEINKNGNQISISVFQAMAADLSNLAVDKATKKKLKSFNALLQSPSSCDEKLADLLQQFQQIQNKAVVHFNSSEPDKKNGFWHRVLGEDQSASDDTENYQSSTATSSVTEEDRSSAGFEPDDAQRLQKMYSAIKERISGVMLAYLDQTKISDELTLREESLRGNLRQGLQWPELPETLSEGIAVLLGSNANSQRDFESFLLMLNSRLSDVSDVLEQSKKASRLQINNTKGVNEKVKKELVQIQSDVEQSHEINSLKKAIAMRLDGISTTMDQYRVGVEDSSDEMLNVVKSLGARMESMEQEANRMRSTIEEQRHQAMKDCLTGLANRSAYDEYALKEVSRSIRHDLKLSLIVCDIDHFKSINDTYGHLSGDKVLKLVSKTIEDNVRLSDFVARYGGEEFVILTPETDLEAAEGVAEKVRGVIESNAFHFKNKPVNITASFGIAQLRAGECIEALFQRADKALYQAKNLGRNQVCIPEDDSRQAGKQDPSSQASK